MFESVSGIWNFLLHVSSIGNGCVSDRGMKINERSFNGLYTCSLSVSHLRWRIQTNATRQMYNASLPPAFVLALHSSAAFLAGTRGLSFYLQSSAVERTDELFKGPTESSLCTLTHVDAPAWRNAALGLSQSIWWHFILSLHSKHTHTHTHTHTLSGCWQRSSKYYSPV